jgi:hypothetical protein
MNFTLAVHIENFDIGLKTSDLNSQIDYFVIWSILKSDQRNIITFIKSINRIVKYPIY